MACSILNSVSSVSDLMETLNVYVKGMEYKNETKDSISPLIFL